MAKQVINIGTTANDGTGDPARTAFSKANDNFTELYDTDVAEAAARISADAATLASAQSYTDAKLEGLQAKQPVDVATTANITLSGTQTIDGFSVNAGARVLVKNQTNATENGIYVCASGAWSRSADMSVASEFPSAYIPVNQGTVNADTQWKCTNDSVVVGTTNIVIVAVSTSGVELTSNKQTDLSSSNPAHYPNVLAVSAGLATRKEKAITIISNTSISAINDNHYNIRAVGTFTDPPGVEGRGYDVEVLEGGSAIIGSVSYSVAGTILRRRYDNGTWNTYIDVDGAQKQMWSLDLFKIRTALSGINNPKYSSVSFASRASNVATLTTLDRHAFKVGEVITTLLPDTTYNGTVTITAVTSNTLSYANTGTDSTNAANDGGATLVSPRVASISYHGDSIGDSFISTDFILSQYRIFGFRGLFVTRSMSTLLGSLINTGGTTDSSAFNLNPAGYVEVLSATNILESKVSVVDTFGAAYKTNNARIIYVKYASGGTFKCQQKAVGKINWEDIVGFTSVDTLDATEQLASINVAYTLGAQFRIVANTSTVKIMGILMEDTTANGLIQNTFTRGGTKIVDSNAMTQASVTAMLNALKPDMITCTYKDAIGTIAADLDAQQIKYNNGYDTDWLFITPYVGQSLGDNQYDIWINHAKKYNKAWFDTRIIIDTYNRALDLGMLRDTTHMGTIGGKNGEAILWNVVGLDKGYQVKYTNPIFNSKIQTSQLFVGNEDYSVRQRNQKAIPFFLNGGLKLGTGAGTQIINHAALTSIGTGSLTMILFFKVPDSPVANSLMGLRSTASGGSADDSLDLSFTSGAVIITTRIAGVSYSWSYLSACTDMFAENAGKVVMIALRKNSTAVSMVDDPFTITINKKQYKTGSSFPVDGLNTINSSFFVVGSSSANLVNDLIVYKAALYNSLLTDTDLDLISDTAEFKSGALLSYNMVRGAGRAVDTNVPGQVGRINNGTIEWLARGVAAPYPYGGSVSNEVNSINIDTGGSAGDQIHTLPAAPKFGDTFEVDGRRNGLWEIQQPVNTQIVEGAGVTVGTNATTLGVGGKIKATGRYDTCFLRCINDARTLTGTGTTIQWVILWKNAPGGLAWT